MFGSNSSVFGGRMLIGDYFCFAPKQIPPGAKVEMTIAMPDEVMFWLQSVRYSSTLGPNSGGMIWSALEEGARFITRLQILIGYEFVFMSCPPDESGLRLRMQLGDQWLFLQDHTSKIELIRMNVLSKEGGRRATSTKKKQGPFQRKGTGVLGLPGKGGR